MDKYIDILKNPDIIESMKKELPRDYNELLEEIRDRRYYGKDPKTIPIYTLPNL